VLGAWCLVLGAWCLVLCGIKWWVEGELEKIKNQHSEIINHQSTHTALSRMMIVGF